MLIYLGKEIIAFIIDFNIKMNTKIILSSIVHKRYGEIQHFFKYKVPSIFLDLDELEIIKYKSDYKNWFR